MKTNKRNSQETVKQQGGGCCASVPEVKITTPISCCGNEKREEENIQENKCC
ncbi:hypothetical protein UJ101_02650 [Flavobacteriaceae bacterium UJ101]|nr:hypothetical protein UJ101_02650 [Flavobacteriaceae bacterium UJ101]